MIPNQEPVEPDPAGDTPPGGEPECAEVLGHIEDYLNSDRTCADEQELRENVAVAESSLGELGVEDLIRALVKRSCCETAPETLRLRIHTQVRIWRTQD